MNRYSACFLFGATALALFPARSGAAEFKVEISPEEITISKTECLEDRDVISFSWHPGGDFWNSSMQGGYEGETVKFDYKIKWGSEVLEEGDGVKFTSQTTRDYPSTDSLKRLRPSDLISDCSGNSGNTTIEIELRNGEVVDQTGFGGQTVDDLDGSIVIRWDFMAPDPPESVAVSPGERNLRVSWQRPSSADSNETLYYKVYWKPVDEETDDGSGGGWGTRFMADTDADTDTDTDADTDTDTDTDADTDTDTSWKELEFVGCDRPFDPWGAGARRYLAAPWAVNPTETTATVLWEAADNGPSTLVVGSEGRWSKVYCVKQGFKADIDAEFEDEHETWLYRVELTGLGPGRTYDYTVPDAEVPVQDTMMPYFINSLEAFQERVESGEIRWEDVKVQHFTTAPEPGSAFTVMIGGDNQSIPNFEKEVADAMVRHQADLFVHLGDIVQDGFCREYTFNYLWIFRPALAEMASVHVSGNHEGDGDQIPYDTYFDIHPAPAVNVNGESVAPGPRSFIYDYGSIRFFVLDTQRDMGPESDQMKWLAAMLEDTVENHPEKRYLFAAWHRPVFSWQAGRLAPYVDYIHGLMMKWKVDAVFTAHIHWYERFDQDGIVYIVTGGAGAGLDPKDIGQPMEGANRVYHDSCRHFLVGDVDDQKIDFRVIRTDDTVIDSFTIHAKDRSDLR